MEQLSWLSRYFPLPKEWLGVRLILITLPAFFDGETDIVNKLFADGLQCLHLRKPEASKKQTADWIENIEPSYRHHIVLHDHHELALQYGTGGIHLNSRNPEPPFSFRREDEAKVGGMSSSEGGQSAFTLSRSCHSIEEVESCQNDFDYVFLSPIFDSITKQGYRAAFSKEELEKARGILSKNVYALGGVSGENLQEVERLGFRGAALLGGFWERMKD